MATADTQRGTERHAEAEVAADLGLIDELPDVVRALILPGSRLVAEVSMAYDVSTDTARSLGHLDWRDYRDLAPFEIPMTIDLVIYGPGPRVAVVDYKGFEEVEPAEDNAQLATCALAVAREGGYHEVEAVIAYRGATWRRPSSATLNGFDLALHAARLRSLMASTDRTVTVNRHCKHCPAFHDCPEQQALARRAADGELAMRVESMIPFERDDEAAAGYEMLQQLKVLLGRLTAALHARASARPIPLRSGRMFGPRNKLGAREYDGAIVHAVISEQLGRETADAAVVMTATQDRFERVVKPKLQRGTFAATKRAVFGEVERRGGMQRHPSVAYEEYDAGPQLVVDANVSTTVELDAGPTSEGAA